MYGSIDGTVQWDPKQWGDILVYYQYPNGGWVKQGFRETDKGYQSGEMTQEKKDQLMALWVTDDGSHHLILDNLSVITEFATLGYTYREYGEASHKEAAQKTMNLLLDSQQADNPYVSVPV